MTDQGMLFPHQMSLDDKELGDRILWKEKVNTVMLTKTRLQNKESRKCRLEQDSNQWYRCTAQQPKLYKYLRSDETKYLELYLKLVIQLQK